MSFLVIAFDASGSRTVLGSRLPLEAAKAIQVYLAETGIYRHVDIEPQQGSTPELPSSSFHVSG
jgi:hypothetical protein